MQFYSKLFSFSVRLYYDNGKDLNFTLEEIGDEIIFIINRLKAVTPGCQVIYSAIFEYIHPNT